MRSGIERYKLDCDKNDIMICEDAKKGHVHIILNNGRDRVETMCYIDVSEIGLEEPGVDCIDHSAPDKVTCPECIEKVKWWFDWANQIKSRRLLSRKKVNK